MVMNFIFHVWLLFIWIYFIIILWNKFYMSTIFHLLRVVFNLVTPDLVLASADARIMRCVTDGIKHGLKSCRL